VPPLDHAPELGQPALRHCLARSVARPLSSMDAANGAEGESRERGS
jgi:hypothetical protein